MKSLEKPPVIKEKWDFVELFQGLRQFDEIVKINNNSYPYWDKWKYYAKNWEMQPEKLWAIVRRFRVLKQPISFTGLKGFQMYISSPSILLQQLHELDLSLGGIFHTNELIPSADKQYYLINSLMEESIASSQIEGASTTRKLAKEMLESNRKPRNHSERMIVNNYAAMQWIVAHRDEKLSPALILELHRIITQDTLAEKEMEGAFRTSDDVRVVDIQTEEVVYIPPAHLLLESTMSDFCAFANDKNKETFFLHPITKAITLHFLIGYIHPFVDGNGRTARALFYWYLIRKGYWLIEYMSVSRIILGAKAQYARAYQYTEFDGNDLTYFVLYNLKAISQALEELKKYIARKQKEKEEVLQLLRNTSYNDRQITILQDILDKKRNVFTVAEVQNRFGVSNQTARTDLEKLAAASILEARRNGNRTQFLVTADAVRKIKA